jgi:hypothetical protein
VRNTLYFWDTGQKTWFNEDWCEVDVAVSLDPKTLTMYAHAPGVLHMLKPWTNLGPNLWGYETEAITEKFHTEYWADVTPRLIPITTPT